MFGRGCRKDCTSQSPLVMDQRYMGIWKGKQISQNYTGDICKYILTCVLVNTDQTLNWLEIFREVYGFFWLSMWRNVEWMWCFGYSSSQKCKAKQNKKRYTPCLSPLDFWDIECHSNFFQFQNIKFKNLKNQFDFKMDFCKLHRQ